MVLDKVLSSSMNMTTPFDVEICQEHLAQNSTLTVKICFEEG